VFLDYVNFLTGSPPSGKDYSDPANQTDAFTSWYDVNGSFVQFDLNGTQHTVVEFTAFDQLGAATNANVQDGGTLDAITSIVISYGAGSALETNVDTTLHSVVIGGHTFTYQFNADGTVDVGNIVDNTTIASFTSTGYNELEIAYKADDNFQIGGFGTSAVTPGPVDLAVPLTVTDGDGDTANGALNIFLMPAAPSTQDHSADLIGDPHTYTSTVASPDIIGSAFDDTLNGDGNANVLYGGAGNDTLNGGAGNDILIGGAGNDTLTGGLGNDVFLLQVTNGGKDTILDFSSGSDQILVDNGSGLTIGTSAPVAAANFHTGDETVAATWNGGTGKEFVFNAATQELWYSANGTGSDKIDLAHISSGVPVAADVHTM
jgi:Ca2+-binding RTX toxin-like protein